MSTKIWTKTLTEKEQEILMEIYRHGNIYAVFKKKNKENKYLVNKWDSRKKNLLGVFCELRRRGRKNLDKLTLESLGFSSSSPPPPVEADLDFLADFKGLPVSLSKKIKGGRWIQDNLRRLEKAGLLSTLSIKEIAKDESEAEYKKKLKFLRSLFPEDPHHKAYIVALTHEGRKLTRMLLRISNKLEPDVPLFLL